MAAEDQRSILAALSELNLFQKKVLQTAIVSEYDRDFNTIATLQPDAPIDFNIQGSNNQFLDLNSSFLELQTKITKENGTALVAEDKVAPINLTGPSLIQLAEMEIGGKTITDPNTRYPLRAWIETVTNFDKSVLETRMLADGWIKDTAGKQKETDPSEAGTNQGLVDRGKWFAGGKVRTFIGRPHLDLFNQDTLIPPNVNVRLRFIPNKSSRLLKTKAPEGQAAQANYKMDIVGAKMYIHTKEINPSLMLAQTKMLNETN